MRRPSPAFAVAVLALLVALGGTAVAAKRYVITKSSQISPQVLASLRRAGPPGPVGLTGATGADGAAGAAGAQGPPGPSNIVSLTRASSFLLLTDGVTGTLSALPAGNWLVVATLDLRGGGPTDVTCALTGPAAVEQPGATVTVPATQTTQLTTSATFVLVAGSSDVTLACHYTGPATPTADGLRMYAIRTGDLDRRTL
jgi:hypothetical protein